MASGFGVGATIIMGLTMVLCAVSLLLPWWTGPAQKATLWSYEIGAFGLETDFDWDHVCNGLQVLVAAEASACNLINVVRVCGVLATLLAMMASFLSCMLSPCCCGFEPSQRRLLPTASCWIAAFCALFAAAAAACGAAIMQSIPADDASVGLFAMALAAAAALVGVALLICSLHSDRHAESGNGAGKYCEKQADWAPQPTYYQHNTYHQSSYQQQQFGAVVPPTPTVYPVVTQPAPVYQVRYFWPQQLTQWRATVTRQTTYA